MLDETENLCGETAKVETAVTISTHMPAEMAFVRDETQRIETPMERHETPSASLCIPRLANRDGGIPYGAPRWGEGEDAGPQNSPPGDADLLGGAHRYILFEALCGSYSVLELGL